ncbi:PspC domain-containing protein [Sanguibacter sp. A247]|uniref:PspC domain-containing protein n=1 Tax=unclassified Sanguibacter TaxID=2645534 RepID=UPI003FD79643
MDTSAHPTGPGTTPPAHPSGTDRFFDTIRGWGLYRAQDRWIGGVAHGIGRRFGVDPVIVRAAFVASLLLGGVGLIAYGLGWAFLPEESDGRIHAQQLVRGDFDIAIVGAFLMLASGFSWSGPWRFLGPWGDGLTGAFWVLAIVGVILWVASTRNRESTPRPHQGAPHATRQQAPDAPAWTSSTPPAPAPAASSATGSTASSAAGSAASSATGSATGSAAGFAAGFAAAPPPAPPVPGWKAPKGPVVLGAGAVSVSLVVGLTALTVAGLLIAERLDRFDGPLLLTSLAVLVVLAGLATVLAGIRGRSAGSLGTLAIIALLIGAPAALWNGSGTSLDVRSAERLVLGDRTSAPTDPGTAKHGFVFGAGSWTIDLTELPLTSETLVVPVSFAMGDSTVILPEGAAWVADVRLGAGDVEGRLADGTLTKLDGVGIRRTVESNAVRDGATPTLRIDLRAGLGSVALNEESR